MNKKVNNKIYPPAFKLSRKVVWDETKMPNDMEIHNGSSLTRVSRTKDGKKNIIGEVVLQSVGQRGGEGTVYKCNIPNKVCKIYHKDKITKFRLAKLLEMQAKNIKIKGICYPEELLYNGSNYEKIAAATQILKLKRGSDVITIEKPKTVDELLLMTKNY